MSMIIKLYQPLILNKSEKVYYLMFDNNENNEESLKIITEIIDNTHYESTLLVGDNDDNNIKTKEYGPHSHFTPPWSTIALEIFHRLGLANLQKIIQTHHCLESEKYHHDPMIEVEYSKTITSGKNSGIALVEIDYQEIAKYNQEYNLALDLFDIRFYRNYYQNVLQRKPNLLELYDLGQSNSEHSRHWFFNAQLYLKEYNSTGELEKETPYLETLFQLVKKTQKKVVEKSLVAFADNSSVIQGYETTILKPDGKLGVETLDFTLTAETHNFPTGISPFPGANTGVGGRIRDTIATGKGALMVASAAGYCVGELDYAGNRALEILIEASNGASDYGNKVGEPIVMGFCRSYGQNLPLISSNKNIPVELPLIKRMEWLKPIMFSSGIGLIPRKLIKKNLPEVGMKIIRIGGPTYKIGMGGGAASSNKGQEDNYQNWEAVQRGDPQMENRLVRVIKKACFQDDKECLIESIHDQGAGGMANVTKEIASPLGGKVELTNIRLGDQSLGPIEIWNSESQEQVSVLVRSENVKTLVEIANSENCPIEIFGEIEDTGSLSVYNNDQEIANFNLNDLLENVPQKKFFLTKLSDTNLNLTRFSLEETFRLNQLNDHTRFLEILESVLSNVTVGSKEFLTSKVDRSVTGLISQQQTVGWSQYPLSNYSLIASGYYNKTGVVSSIGERHLSNLGDPKKMVRMAVGELLTNLAGVQIESFKKIKLSANWMWAAKLAGFDHLMTQGVESLSETLISLGIAVDGGKDSLSMVTFSGEECIPSPPELVLTSYTQVPNIWNRVTPDIKEVDYPTHLFYLDLANTHQRLGGSILMEELGIFLNLENDQEPDFPIDFHQKFLYYWKRFQYLIMNNEILALHDRSDGGLITTILEMSFGSMVGLDINISSPVEIYQFLFNQELGIVFQAKSLNKISKTFPDKLLHHIAVIPPKTKTTKQFRLSFDFEPELLIDLPLEKLLSWWSKPSDLIDKYQRKMEKIPNWQDHNLELNQSKLDKKTDQKRYQEGNSDKKSKKALVLRDDGSNGDQEMMAYLLAGGYQVENYRTIEIKEKKINLLDYDFLAFVGGFSYCDVLGAGKAWAEMIKRDKYLSEQFDLYYNHPEKKAMGICNGCQLMARLGWLGDIRLVENDSESFESWWVNLEPNHNNLNQWIKNLKSNIGCWLAHKEGKFLLGKDFNQSQVAFRYTSDSYPNNPNGSADNIAGLVSESGRHLGMMPHPERSFLKWQDPTPKYFQEKYNHQNPELHQDYLLENPYSGWLDMIF